MEDEETVRKIRIAYLMGWEREMFQLNFDYKYHGGEPSEEGCGFGDYMMFLDTPEEHAKCLNYPEAEKDVFGTGTITAEDVTSLLKTIYGEDYEKMKAIGDEDREEIEQEQQQKKEEEET